MISNHRQHVSGPRCLTLNLFENCFPIVDIIETWICCNGFGATAFKFIIYPFVSLYFRRVYCSASLKLFSLYQPERGLWQSLLRLRKVVLEPPCLLNGCYSCNRSERFIKVNTWPLTKSLRYKSCFFIVHSSVDFVLVS